MPTQAIVNVSVKMSPALRERIQKLADVRKQSAHSVMVQALETYVSREEKREVWQAAEIHKALKEADAGDFVTEEEMQAFWKQWTE